MRCDLHVHTRHSGMCTVPVAKRICRESYNDPVEVYDTLKRRGMDLITVTDHDSIDAVEPLRRYPDFFLSEEVTCWTPSGSEIHVGVYGIQERHHVELQRRSRDLYSLTAWLNEQKLFFAINHVFSGLTGSRAGDDFTFFAEFFPGVEVRNGQMLPAANRAALEMAAMFSRSHTGGSDAHTLAALGRTYTDVAGARTAEEYLEGLRRGAGIVDGASGSYTKLTTAVFSIILSMVRQQRWTLALAPVFCLVPLVTLGNVVRELAFLNYWKSRVLAPPVTAPAQLFGEASGN